MLLKLHVASIVRFVRSNIRLGSCFATIKQTDNQLFEVEFYNFFLEVLCAMTNIINIFYMYILLYYFLQNLSSNILWHPFD